MAQQLKISRGSSPIWIVTVTQPVTREPVDLTNTPVSAIECDLPFQLVVAKLTGQIGKFSITFPNTAAMKLNKSYKFKLLIGAPGAPGTFATKPLEVVAG